LCLYNYGNDITCMIIGEMQTSSWIFLAAIIQHKWRLFTTMGEIQCYYCRPNKQTDIMRLARNRQTDRQTDKQTNILYIYGHPHTWRH